MVRKQLRAAVPPCLWEKGTPRLLPLEVLRCWSAIFKSRALQADRLAPPSHLACVLGWPRGLRRGCRLPRPMAAWRPRGGQRDPLPTLPTGKTCQQADPCASNPCANGGQCLPFESSYICGCPAGFHGPTCRQDVNECSQSPGPCLHGGTCLNEPGSYRCVCRASHTGPQCELPYVPCSPSPCQNGGTCHPTGDTAHECTCLPGMAHGWGQGEGPGLL